jgi:hypothetical protein
VSGAVIVTVIATVLPLKAGIRKVQALEL